MKKFKIKSILRGLPLRCLCLTNEPHSKIPHHIGKTFNCVVAFLLFAQHRYDLSNQFENIRFFMFFR